MLWLNRCARRSQRRRGRGGASTDSPHADRHARPTPMLPPPRLPPLCPLASGWVPPCGARFARQCGLTSVGLCPPVWLDLTGWGWASHGMAAAWWHATCIYSPMNHPPTPAINSMFPSPLSSTGARFLPLIAQWRLPTRACPRPSIPHLARHVSDLIGWEGVSCGSLCLICTMRLHFTLFFTVRCSVAPDPRAVCPSSFSWLILMPRRRLSDTAGSGEICVTSHRVAVPW